MKVERIVVGVDASDNARRAVEWAAGLAASVGAEVVAAHALGLLERLPGHPDPVPTHQHRAEVDRLLTEVWCAPLAEAGVRWRAEAREGNPVTVLLSVGDELDADLLVVGSRGLGGFPELLLGSTSTQVAQHSRRPVVIIPAGR